MRNTFTLIIVMLMLATPAWARDISEFHKSQRASHGWAQNVQKIIDSLSIRISYSGDNIEYVGYAIKGTATSADDWIVYYLQYSGSNLTSKTTAYGAWDDRASLSYE